MQAIKQFFKTHPPRVVGLLSAGVSGGLFIIEHFITDNYWATRWCWTAMCPSASGSSSPYVSWSPLLVVLGVYLILKDGEGFRRYMWYIMVTFTTAVVFCIPDPQRAGSPPGGDGAP